jgi:5-methyltetrahydrofolate--homocysteine methyltransferase
MTILTSRNGKLYIGPDHPVVLISDQLRLGPQWDEASADAALEQMVTLARRAISAGLDMVDLMVTGPATDESAAFVTHLLPRLAVAVHDAVGCAISLDSRHPAALRAALTALRPYKVLINSVTAEADVLATLLPLAAEFGAAIIGMPIGDHHGLPKDVQGRMKEAEVILERAAAHGIPSEDVVMDAICLAPSAELGSMAVSLETLRRFHDELGVATTLGISNAGYGMPEPFHIALAYLLSAMPWGLDSALVNPRTPLLIEAVRAGDFLTHRDPYGRRYLQHYRATQRT